MSSDPWIELYERAEVETDADSLLNKLKSVDVRYLNLGSAGTGAMKEVVRTEDRTTGRLIAKATLIDHQNRKSVEAFLREARITAHLQHPNIVPIYDIGLDEKERPYFTMKLIKGHSLGRVLEELQSGNQDFTEQYPLNRLVDIFLKVCDAIAYAHSEGIIHLDLKPDNIQVSSFGDVVVCDWGLATLLDHDEENDGKSTGSLKLENRFKTLTGEIKGTPGYMAPEQALGNKTVKDRRTDIFSLGCILYQMLTRRLAIRGKSLERILENTKTGNITPPSKRRPDLNLPSSLEAICMKAVSCRPEDRYQAVQEIIKDIEAFRSGFATEAEEISLFNQLRLFYQRNRVFCLTTLSFSLVIILMAFLFFRSIREKEEIALTALAGLKKEQAINKRIGKEASVVYAEKAEKAYLEFNSEAAEALADLALVLDPHNVKALEYKGKLCFVRQDFDQAYKNLKQTGDSFFDDLTRFCQQTESVQNEKLRIQKLLPLSRSLIKPQRYALIGHLLANSVMHQSDDLLEKDLIWLLSQYNQGKNFTVKITPVQNGLFKFDLSKNRGLTNIDCLKDFPIVNMDISDTRVTEINFAISKKEKGFRHLRQLSVSKDQLSSKTLWWVNENYKVIFK